MICTVLGLGQVRQKRDFQIIAESGYNSAKGMLDTVLSDNGRLDILTQLSGAA